MISPRYKAIYPHIALLAALLSVGVASADDATGALKPVTDLLADSRLSAKWHRPIVLLFSLPGCHFCDEVRQNYLLPLARDSTTDTRPIVREIVITGERAIIGFGGEGTDEKALSRRYGVRVAPSVLMLDPFGKALLPALVGGDTSGLYGGYLDNALTQAQRLLHAAGPGS